LTHVNASRWAVAQDRSSTAPSADLLFAIALLLSDEGTNRRFYGATHKVFSESDSTPIFEVLVLKHLLNFLVNPENELANQTVLFG
jgi:hypothetical protein